MLCFLQDNPFIFTEINSLPSPPVTTTTASTVDSPAPPIPETRCPSSMPVLVPVIVGIVSLLAGVVLAWLILASSKPHESKVEKAVEMKGTAF